MTASGIGCRRPGPFNPQIPKPVPFNQAIAVSIMRLSTIVNPLNCYPAPLKSGNGVTYRGDGNISFYRHAMGEFDTLSMEDQIRFWSAIQLPLVALIHSGGKSIHAWFDVQQWATVKTPAQWQSEIKVKLYGQLLTPFGVDPACSNAARLSRLPGVFRTEKQAYQRLLWLSPEGRPVCQ